MSTFFCSICTANCFVFVGSSWSFREISFNGRPLTPPFLLIALISSCAASSAGASKGAMFLVVSTTAPMTIGFGATAVSVRAAAVAARTPAATAMITSARRARVMCFITSPLLGRLMPRPSVPPAPGGRDLFRRLTSDQVWFRVRGGGNASGGRRRRRRPAPDDGGSGSGAPARGDHHGRADAGHPPAAGGPRPAARDEHLADPRGGAAARGARARRARAPSRGEGDAPRRGGAPRPLRDPAHVGRNGGAPGPPVGPPDC